MVGVPDTLNIKFLNDYYVIRSQKYWKKWLNKNKFKLMKILNKNKQYFSSLLTRFYINKKDKSKISQYVKRLKQIWDKKDVVIIEGDKSRLGIGNDLFDNMNSIQRIICPSQNAFDVYDKILKKSLKIKKDKLILIALGPTATILTYDLYKNGYHVIDVGHIDIEYEWYLRNVSQKIKIKNKYVLEVKKGTQGIREVKDKRYYSQIIFKIQK